MQEPIYDPERLKTDDAYTYSMLDVFTAHIESLLSYEDQVEYFIRISIAMGTHKDENGVIWQRSGMGMFGHTNTGPTWKETDDNGAVISQKHWGLAYPNNDKDLALTRKVWFEKVRHTEYSSFEQWVNEPLEQRKARYFASSEGWNSTDYARLQLTAIESMIKQFQTEYTVFREGKGKLTHEPEPVKQQRLNAPALIESELLGNPAINWLAFIRSSQLRSFGILWDMVAFKLFLLKEISNPTQPDQQGAIKSEPSATKTKRGKYIKHGRDQAIEQFRYFVRNTITTELRNRRTPNPAKIIAKAYKDVSEKVDAKGERIYNERTLRGYLPAANHETIFGEIHRQVSNELGLSIS
ncbi:hypothetical protein [Fibrivirga algicola]|uniref:Mannosyl-glycoprotein endo-beta-N-acetylglucosamidase-like domain-containing protein n=1 Tax=Fibrivirga algicola TaxID=2950420 RepID=A0ABX0QGL9_9BACT|nr:hypothetical protein [Fibrivirga algicola]NID11544.1 hypothetical protein [Fibrivirga algicola]